VMNKRAGEDLDVWSEYSGAFEDFQEKNISTCRTKWKIYCLRAVYLNNYKSSVN